MAEKLSYERVGAILKTILLELQAQGGRAQYGDLLARAVPKLGLSAYERAQGNKAGLERWRVAVHFFSVELVKAGFLIKNRGTWELTQAGEKAILLSDRDFRDAARAKYQEWKRSRLQTENVGPEPLEDDLEAEEVVRRVTFEQALEQARSEIDRHLTEMDEYDFQKLVAELLKAMGYHILYLAPPGRDGGIDIIANRDPLGLSTPRLKVQVKHREAKAAVNIARELNGLLRTEGEIGLIVSSGGFTREVEREIRSTSHHLELMDQNRLVALWEEHYEKISEEGRALLPLVKISFLAPTEE